MVFFKVIIAGVRLTVSVQRIGQPAGVCSQLPDGRHILMWDFDDTQLLEAKIDLNSVAAQNRLSDVYIFESSPGNYMAYCFTAMPFNEAFRIVASTPKVDSMFLRLSAVRGYFTLRIEQTAKRPKPLLVDRVVSPYPPNSVIDDLSMFVRYETGKL